LAVTGLIGMVAHFWIEEYSGMAWSAATITCGALYMTGRIAIGVVAAPIQRAVKLHIVLACLNFWLAALMGIAIAIDKAAPFLPAYILANVFAHSHLAAIGWATMMIVGISYRLLPIPTGMMLLVGRRPLRRCTPPPRTAVLALVGFLVQAIVGIEVRWLPLVTWCWADARGEYRVPPFSPHVMRDRTLQALGLTGWIIGVPAFAGGLAAESAEAVGVGATALFAAVAIGAIDHVFVVNHAFRPATQAP
jgi:hypothetical protein